MTGELTGLEGFVAPPWRLHGTDAASVTELPNNQAGLTHPLRQKGHSRPPTKRDK